MPQGKRKRSTQSSPYKEKQSYEDVNKIFKGESPEIEKDDAYKLRTLRGMLEPPPKTVELQGVETTLPPSPYPFNQPPAMTRELDDSLKRIRQISPGAGSAQTSVLTNVPPTGYIARRSGGRQDSILKGEQDPTELSLLGLAQVGDARPYGPEKNPNVYINPKIKSKELLDQTVAHELSHRNIPSTEHGLGTYSGFKGFKPGTDYLEHLMGLLSGRKQEPKEEPEDVHTIAEKLRDALIKAGIDPKTIKIQ